MKKKQYSYDSKCEDLARHFLPDDAKESEVKELAQGIQDHIETELSWRESLANADATLQQLGKSGDGK